VLHEDDAVQVGIKMEFQGHQGRIAIFIGNKSASPLHGLMTQFSSQPALALNASQLASVIAPRQQQQQMVIVECVGAYAEPPQLAIRKRRPYLRTAIAFSSTLAG
jgi:AP-2 complex subunit alpha